MGNLIFGGQPEEPVIQARNFEELHFQVRKIESSSCRVSTDNLLALISQSIREKEDIRRENGFFKTQLDEKATMVRNLENQINSRGQVEKEKQVLLVKLGTVQQEAESYKLQLNHVQQSDKQQIEELQNRLLQLQASSNKRQEELLRENKMLSHAKTTLSLECEKLNKQVEVLNQTVADKSQEVIDVMADMDSTTSSNDGDKVRPHNVHKQFDELMDSIHELQLSVKESCDSSTENYSTRMTNLYKKILESLFEPGLWKLLKKPMESKRLFKTSMCLVLVGKQDAEKGMDKRALEIYLLPHIEASLKKLIEKEAGQALTDSTTINENIKESAANALTLAALSVVSKPAMGIILPKKGEIYNPEKHEDATCEKKMVVSSIKRPGLMCTRDNNIFIKASVETETKDA